MNVGESLAPIFDKFFPGRNHEKASVSLEDLKVGVWTSKKGNIRVKSLEHPFDITDYSISDVKNQSLVVGSLEELRQKFEDEEYVFDESLVAPLVGEKVVNLAEVRAVREGARQAEEQIDPAVENKKIQIDTEGAHTALLGESKKIFAILNEAEENPITEEMRTRATELFEQGEALYKEYTETEEGNGENQLISEDVLKAKRGRFEKIHAILTKMLALSLEVQELTKGKIEGKPRGSARAARRATRGSVSVDSEGESSVEPKAGNAVAKQGNLDALSQALVNARKVENIVPPVIDAAKGKAGTPKGNQIPAILKKNEPGAGDASGADGGGEGPKEGLEVLLKTRQEKVEAFINGITTPQGFAEFRRTLRKVETKIPQGGMDVKWYFINQDTLAEELSKKEGLSEPRELEDVEKDKVYIVEDFLRFILNKKFLELKDADVANFFNQEQAKITAAQSETDLDALVESWPKTLEDTAAWKDMADILTPGERGEKKKIDVGYDEVVVTLKQNAEIHRKDLQMVPAYQALDAFLARGDKAKEKVRMFQEIIDKEYGAWSSALYKEAKKIGGTISRERRWALWQEQGGDAIVERVVVAHLQRFDGVDPEEGKKIFQALRETLMEKTKQEA